MAKKTLTRKAIQKRMAELQEQMIEAQGHLIDLLWQEADRLKVECWHLDERVSALEKAKKPPKKTAQK
jgi:hypothetical protein